MAKIFNYSIMMIGISTLFAFAGIALPSSLLWSSMGFGSPETIITSLLVGKILLLLGGFTAGAIVVGVAVIVERGAKQKILDAGYKYYAAYSLEDLGL
jgi:hypothetical protein